jgi:glutathione peroxidase
LHCYTSEMKIIYIFTIGLLLTSCSSQSQNTSDKTTAENTMTNTSTSFYDLSVLALNETDTLKMADFKGKKVLLVNVASKCGYTPQYTDLQKLHEQYGDKVQIIGLPCNQFLGQEPGGKEDIAQFCSVNYGVTFPLSSKIKVKGGDQDPIYQWLTKKELNGVDDYKVGWNFNKFLIDENGKLIGHYESSVKPLDPDLVAAIEK